MITSRINDTDLTVLLVSPLHILDLDLIVLSKFVLFE